MRTASPNAPDDGRPTAVYVASLTWWTTDAELETVLGEFGRVKSLTFSPIGRREEQGVLRGGIRHRGRGGAV